MAGLTDELSPESVGGYLRERGVVGPDEVVRARPLGGGVSSVVLDVRTPGRRLVVKQPLELFHVSEEWFAKRERVLVEADALGLAASVLPGCVPSVVDVDRDRLVVVMESATDGWHSWKEELLEGSAREGIAARLGSMLSTWHRSTTTADVLGRFADPEIFGQQRVDPYYRTTMERRPELARAIKALCDRMLATRTCLVHGDWSPKNVLCGREGDDLWAIDWEITHAGDPAFDVAFMTNHLMLKAIHRPEMRGGYERCARALWSAYGRVPDPAYVLGHAGALMVARVDGKSPAEYLTPPERQVARRLGSSLVTDPPATLDGALERAGR